MTTRDHLKKETEKKFEKFKYEKIRKIRKAYGEFKNS